MTSMSNSRSRRSCTISIWSNPKNPQRKPKPKATDDSGEKVRAASFSWSFSSDARKSSKSSASIGYTPANTIGLASSNPSIASTQGRATCVMVSPTFTSVEVLIPEMIYPTLPAEISLVGCIPSFSTPISSASYSFPVLKNRTRSPDFIVPFTTLK